MTSPQKTELGSPSQGNPYPRKSECSIAIRFYRLVTSLNSPGVTRMTDYVPLTALSRELTTFAGKQAPNYRKLWMLTVDGRIPAEQMNGRYQVRRADLPGIAVSLGLTTPDRVAA